MLKQKSKGKEGMSQVESKNQKRLLEAKTKLAYLKQGKEAKVAKAE